MSWKSVQIVSDIVFFEEININLNLNYFSLSINTNQRLIISIYLEIITLNSR
jgi:hypothetical protein